MKHFFTALFVFVALAIMLATTVYAASGKLTGKVVDAKTGGPIVGASVRIDNTQLGAAVSLDGRYIILNIPPGTYDVTITSIGYTKTTVRGVIINSDITSFQDFKVEPATVGLPEVVVIAKRKLIDITQTSGRSIMNAGQIATLPAASMQEILATSPSVFNGHVRGSKQFQTSYMVDGIDLTDKAYEAATSATSLFTTYLGVNLNFRQNADLVDLPASTIEEVSVNSGVSSTSSSPTTGGVVDINLKQGRGKITGSAEFKYAPSLSAAGLNVYTGVLPDGTTSEAHYLGEMQQYLTSNPAKAARYTWTPGEYSYGSKPTYDAEFNLGGGITDNLGFMADAKYINSYGRYPNEFNRSLNATATVDWSIKPTMKLTGIGILSDQGYFLGWQNSMYNEVFKYYLQGVPRYALGTAAGSLKFVNTVSDKTYYEVQASYTNSPSEVGFVESNGQINPIGSTTGNFITFADPAQLKEYASDIDMSKFFSMIPQNESGSETSFTPYGTSPYKLSRPGVYYENQDVQQYNLKGDFNSQFDSHHLLTAGFDFKFYNYHNLRRFSPSGDMETEDYTVHPAQYGLFAQDRIEYSGLIVNVGLRVDGWNAGAKDIGNYFAPYTLVPDSEVLGGVNTNGSPEVIKFNRMVVNRTKNIPVKWLFEPMVGISHPISDRASMYYSFSRTMQPQPFTALYGISYSEFHSSLPTVTDVGQDPMESTNYEMGLQYSVSDFFGINVSAYYRTIKNYNEGAFSVTPRTGIGIPYSILFYGGYADSRGIELTLRSNRLPVSNIMEISGVFTYTFSYIRSLVGGPPALRGQNTSSFSTLAGDSAKYGGGLPFGNANYFTGYESPILGGSSSSFAGYDRQDRLSLILFFDIPKPISSLPVDFRFSTFTTAQSGFLYPLSLADPRSRQYGQAPWDVRTDMRFEADIMAGRLVIVPYIEVKNLFNNLNIIGYQNSVAGQLQWEQKGIPTGQNGTAVFADGSNAYDIAQEVYFGLSIKF